MTTKKNYSLFPILNPAERQAISSYNTFKMNFFDFVSLSHHHSPSNIDDDYDDLKCKN